MEQISIGVLVNTHGLRGEVKIKPMTDFADIRFQKGAQLYVEGKDGVQPLTIRTVKKHKGMLLVTFEDYEDINQVEAWKGCRLFIDAASVHELEEDEAYYFELRGCSVEDEEGNVLGEVREILETSANAILRVSDGKREFLVPYVKAFILSFSREEKRIVIRLMEGLL